MLESYTLGFLIIGGVYLVISVLIYQFRKAIIDIQVIKKLSDIFYNN